MAVRYVAAIFSKPTTAASRFHHGLYGLHHRSKACCARRTSGLIQSSPLREIVDMLLSIPATWRLGMTDGKHTPGPWSVPHFAQPDVNCSCGYVLTDHMMGAVATVHCSGEGEYRAKHGDNPNFEQAVANARLIAAAPDLLEALKAVRSNLVRLAWDENSIMIEGIDKAIASAEVTP